MILVGVGLVLIFETPRILLIVPVIAIVGCATMSYIRRGCWRIAAVVVAAISVGVLFFSSLDTAARLGQA